MSGITPIVQQRFFDLMLEFKPGTQRVGLRKTATSARMQGGGSVDTSSKLDIERQAAQSRLADQQARAQFVEFTQARLHDLVADELFNKLNRYEQVSANLFNLSEGFPAVLDVLAARAATLSQLEKVIDPLDWLKEDILKYANQPNLRKSAANSFLKELKPALGLIGLDNLQQLIPLLGLKRCLPHATDPFSGFKSNFWQYSVDTAKAAKRLAEETGERGFMAYCAALFQSIGYFVVTRTYLRTYQQIKQQAMYDARDNRDIELTYALDSLDADGGFLTSCLLEFAPVMSADVVASWSMRMMPLAGIMDQLAEGPLFAGTSQLARVVHLANAFVQCQWLLRARQISDIEIRQYFLDLQMRPELLSILKNTDSPHLEIN